MKDEEQTLKTVLSVAKRFCDEMIVVDTGSKDSSKEIAKSMGATVFDFEWENDFSLARNFAIDKATGDYAIWLDADDVIEESDIQKIISLKENDFFNCDMIMLKYAVSPHFSYFRERIFRLDGKNYFEGFVHEAMAIKGKVLRVDAQVAHKKVKKSGKRNLELYLCRDERDFSPRERYYFARELYYNGLYKQASSEFSKFLEVGSFRPNLIDASILKYKCEMMLNKGGEEWLINSIKFGVTPQSCYEIADHFFNKKKWDNAIFWYKSCLSSPDLEGEGAFCDSRYKSLFPLLQLTVCYYNKGDIERAKAVAKRTHTLFPNDEKAIFNFNWSKSLS